MVWYLAVLVSVDILRPWPPFNQAVGGTRNTMQDIHLLSSKQILGLPPTPASPHDIAQYIFSPPSIPNSRSYTTRMPLQQGSRLQDKVAIITGPPPLPSIYLAPKLTALNPRIRLRFRRGHRAALRRRRRASGRGRHQRGSGPGGGIYERGEHGIPQDGRDQRGRLGERS